MIDLKKINPKIVFLLLFVATFLSFAGNIFNGTDSTLFETHEVYSEMLVIHKFYADGQGIENNCSLGMLDWHNSPSYRDYKKYLVRLPSKNFNKLSCYTSQVGLVSTILKPFWNIADSFTKNSKKRFYYNFKVIRTITALISSFVIALFFLWFFLEFRSWKICFLIIPLLLWNDDIVVMGKNVYWQIWTWFAPIVFNLYFLRNKNNGPNPSSYLVMMGATSLLIYLKCLMGYEYISTIFVATIVPTVYYSIKFNHSKRKMMAGASLLFLSGVIAFFLAIATHYHSLAKDGRNPHKILKTIIEKRTHGKDFSSIDKIYHDSMSASVFTVLKRYLFRHKGLQTFWLLAFLVALFYCKKWGLLKKGQIRGLLWVVILSFGGTISWYVLAKGHSYIHLRQNYILWFLPLNYFLYTFLIMAIGHYIKNNFVIKLIVEKKK